MWWNRIGAEKTRAETSQKGQVEQYFLHTHTNGEMNTSKAECKVKLTHGDLWVWHHATFLFQWDFTAFSYLRETYFQLQVLCSKMLECAEKNIYESMLFLNYGVTHVLSVAFIFTFFFVELCIVEKQTVLVLRN